MKSAFLPFAAAALFGVVAMVTGLALPIRAMVVLGGELLVGALGVVLLRPHRAVNGYVWAVTWALGATAVAMVTVARTPSVASKPLLLVAIVCLTLPLDVLLLSLFGLTAALGASHLDRNRTPRAHVQ